MANVKEMGVIIAAGGIGQRMQRAMPKQFLPIDGKPIVLYSMELFISMEVVSEIVIVCVPEYRYLFTEYEKRAKVTFALPGARRQDSVYNGLLQLGSASEFVCVHDAARPFISKAIIERTLQAAKEVGAAAAAMPVKSTIKEVDSNGIVIKTPDRSMLWEIQTPQIVRSSLLRKGFDYAYQNEITVTDDVSLVELLKSPVKIVEGSYGNIKITTPEDLKNS